MGRSAAAQDTPAEIQELVGELKRGNVPEWFAEANAYLHGAKYAAEQFGTRNQRIRFQSRIIAIQSVAIVACIAGLVLLGLRPSSVPYVIAYDKTTGVAVPMGPATEMDQKDQNATIAMAHTFVRGLRTVTDAKTQEELRAQAFHALSKGTLAHTKAKEFLEQRKNLPESRQIAVEVHRVSLMQSGKVVMVEWQEHETQGGLHRGDAYYSALLTMSVARQTMDKNIMANPLGIFVDDFTVSKLR